VDVRRNGGAAGIDQTTLAMVEEYGVDRLLDEVATELREGRYRPWAARRVFIPKPGSTERRPLSIPTVRDRVVQAATKIVLEPIFEADMADCSFGFRPRRSAHDALQVLIDECWRGRRWVVETDTRKLGLNRHVAFIHCKFLLHDPLGDDPIVVTGSANFSAASTNENDENMVIVRGDRRVADIYFTEFNRLFNHYYFRSIAERSNPTETLRGLHLAEDDRWLEKYRPGTLRSKRVECLIRMAL